MSNYDDDDDGGDDEDHDDDDDDDDDDWLYTYVCRLSFAVDLSLHYPCSRLPFSFTIAFAWVLPLPLFVERPVSK